MSQQQNQPKLEMIPLNKIDPHPLNANEMNEAYFDKLKENIKRTGRYPALILIPRHDRYLTADGWHRSQILRELGYKEAKAEIWEVDAKEEKILLATLNRLRGTDDTKKRGKLLSELYSEFNDDKALLNFIPESERALDSLLSTLKDDAHFDLQTERGLIEEKLSQAGVDISVAERIASNFTPPSDVFVLKFVFRDGLEYNDAVKMFGKRGDTKKLVELIKAYGNTNTDKSKTKS